MNLKKTLIFAAFFLALLGYILYVDNPTEKKVEEAKILFSVHKKEDLSSINVKNSKSEFLLINKDGAWKINQAGFNAIDTGSVTSLETALLGFKPDNTISEDEVEKDLGIYGLAKPELKVLVNFKGKETEIQFGKKNEFTNKRYARTADSGKLYLVGEDLYLAANKSSDEIRDKTPLEFNDNQLKSIRVTSGKKSFEFVSDTNGKWTATKPLAVTLSASSIAELTKNIRNLKAVKFYDPKDENSEITLKSYGLDSPVGTIDLIFKDELKILPIKVTLGNKKKEDKEFFFSVSEIKSVFALEANPGPLLLRDFDNFREKNLFAFSSDDVMEARFENISKETPSLMLTKTQSPEGAKWSVDGKEADAVFAEGLIKDLAGLRVESFPSKNLDFGFTTPVLKVVVKLGSDPEKLRTLVVGKKWQEGKVTKGYFAGVGDLIEPFVISEATLKRITPKKESLIQVSKVSDQEPLDSKQ